MSSEDLEQKHLNYEARRRRFDPGSKYGGHGGASLVRSLPKSQVSIDGYRDVYLKIQRPRDEDGNVLVSDLDKEMQDLLNTDTDGKVVGEAPGGNWRELPDLLEAACTSKFSKRDRSCPHVVITTYSVPGVAWMTPNEEERRKLEQRREAKLSLADPDGRRVYCRLRDTPLEKILDKTLLDGRARIGGSAVADGSASRAMVLQEDCRSCWCAPVNDSGSTMDAHLEVDLGATCRVTYISTQGRFPPIHRTDKETGMRVVLDGHPAFRNWVTRYELSYRVLSGHDWVNLGEFKGNSDMTTEVAHELVQVAKQPLQCRYLRFRPLNFEGRPAMRVGVYGERLEEADLNEAASGENVIQYSICCVKEDANLRRTRVGCGLCRYGCAKCTKYRGICRSTVDIPKQRRMRMRMGVIEEVRKLNCDDGESVPFWDDRVPQLRPNEGDADRPEHTAALSRTRSSSDPELSAAASSSVGDSFVHIDSPAEHDVLTPLRQSALARTRSFSDPELSAAASSSVGDSFVQLDDAASFSGLDSDDWVAV